MRVLHHRSGLSDPGELCHSGESVSQCSHVVLHHAFINKALVSTVKFYYRKLIVFGSSNLIRLTIFLSERIGQYK